jgi:hypothetical protein
MDEIEMVSGGVSEDAVFGAAITVAAGLLGVAAAVLIAAPGAVVMIGAFIAGGMAAGFLAADAAMGYTMSAGLMDWWNSSDGGGGILTAGGYWQEAIEWEEDYYA